jgi:hypothetical protein
MSSVTVDQATLKRLRKVKTDAEYDSMEEFLKDVVAFLEDHLEDFTEEYAEVVEEEEDEDEDTEE